MKHNISEFIDGSIKNTMLNILDAIGLSIGLSAGYMHITEWLKAIDYNQTMLTVGTVIGLAYGLAKLNNMIMKNRKLRRELKTDKKEGIKNE